MGRLGAARTLVPPVVAFDLEQPRCQPDDD
jgi:hypothetical protein